MDVSMVPERIKQTQKIYKHTIHQYTSNTSRVKLGDMDHQGDMDQFITSITRIKYNRSLRRKVIGCLMAVFQHGVL